MATKPPTRREISTCHVRLAVGIWHHIRWWVDFGPRNWANFTRPTALSKRYAQRYHFGQQGRNNPPKKWRNQQFQGKFPKFFMPQRKSWTLVGCQTSSSASFGEPSPGDSGSLKSRGMDRDNFTEDWNGFWLGGFLGNCDSELLGEVEFRKYHAMLVEVIKHMNLKH